MILTHSYVADFAAETVGRLRTNGGRLAVFVRDDGVLLATAPAGAKFESAVFRHRPALAGIYTVDSTVAQVVADIKTTARLERIS